MRSTDLGSISATHSENHATDDEIGAAELYHYECVLKTSLGGAAAPPWLEELINTLCQTRQIIERIEQSQKRTSAVIENMRIGKSNVELAKNTGSTSYRAKKKEVHCDYYYNNKPATLVICYNDSCYFLARLMGMAQSWLTTSFLILIIHLHHWRRNLHWELFSRRRSIPTISAIKQFSALSSIITKILKSSLATPSQYVHKKLQTG